MLEAVDLECVRGDRPLFSHLSFSLRPGELLHVTGVNGSGKTTLLRTLCGLTHHHAGEIRWKGAAIRKLGDEYPAQLAYVGHTNGIHKWFNIGRHTINPMPVTPGPCSPPPPVQSPFSDCVVARNCKPRSYISRTSRGTTSPMRVLGG